MAVAVVDPSLVVEIVNVAETSERFCPANSCPPISVVDMVAAAVVAVTGAVTVILILSSSLHCVSTKNR